MDKDLVGGTDTFMFFYKSLTFCRRMNDEKISIYLEFGINVLLATIYRLWDG